MEYRRFGSRIVMRLDKGDEITQCLLAAAAKERISMASVTGIGATDDFTVGIFDIDAKAYNRFTYTGNHEITALAGNINTMNGEPYTHVHITCAGPDGTVRGGHLLNAVISLTCEIVIGIVDGSVDRKRDETLGINKLSF